MVGPLTDGELVAELGRVGGVRKALQSRVVMGFFDGNVGGLIGEHGAERALELGMANYISFGPVLP